MVLPIRISSSAALELVPAPSTRPIVTRASLSTPVATWRRRRLSLPAEAALSKLCQRILTSVRIMSPCYLFVAAALERCTDPSGGPIDADAACLPMIPVRRPSYTRRGPLRDQAARRQPASSQARRRRTCPLG